MKERNLSKMISWMSVFLVVIVAVNFAITTLTFQQVNRNTRRQQEEVFYMDIAEVGDRLSMIHMMMASELASDNDLDLLLAEEDKWNLSLPNYRTIRRVNMLLGNWKESVSYRMGFYLYCRDSEIEMASSTKITEFEEAARIHPELVERIKERDYQVGWQLMELAGETYLVDFVQKNTITITCFIHLGSLFEYLGKPVYGEDYRFRVWTDGGGG